MFAGIPRLPSWRVPTGPIRVRRNHRLARGLEICRIPSDWAHRGFGRNMAPSRFASYALDYESGGAAIDGFQTGQLGLGWGSKTTTGLIKLGTTASSPVVTIPYDPQTYAANFGSAWQPLTMAVVAERMTASNPSGFECLYGINEVQGDTVRANFYFGSGAGSNGNFMWQNKAGNDLVWTVANGAPTLGQPFVAIATTIASNNRGCVFFNPRTMSKPLRVQDSTSLTVSSNASRVMGEGFGGAPANAGTTSNRANAIIYAVFVWSRAMQFEEEEAWVQDPFGMIEPDASFIDFTPPVLPSGGGGDLYTVATG